MLEVMKFYVSGFWVWCGLTFGPAVVLASVAQVIAIARARV